MTMLLLKTFTSVINFHLVLSALLVCVQFHIDLCFITIPVQIPSTEKTNNCLWNAYETEQIARISFPFTSQSNWQKGLSMFFKFSFQNVKRLQSCMYQPELAPPNLERVKVTLLEPVSEWHWNGTETSSGTAYPRQTFPSDHELRLRFEEPF